jgi:general secretion pathway protein J
LPLSSTWRNRGFTLLEVLVALVLLVILSGALYGTYFSLMRGRETAVEKMEKRRELAVTLDQLRRELSAAYFPPGSGLHAIKDQQGTQLHFVVEDRDYFGKPASTLDFSTIAPPRSGSLPESDQVQIIYKPVEKDKKLQLTRQARDRYVSADPRPYLQMGELEGFLVECSTDGTKWVRSWNAPALNSGLPLYVRVTLRLKEGEKTGDYSTTALIRMQS